MNAQEALEWYDEAVDHCTDYLGLDREEQKSAWNAIQSLIDSAMQPVSSSQMVMDSDMCDHLSAVLYPLGNAEMDGEKTVTIETKELRLMVDDYTTLIKETSADRERKFIAMQPVRMSGIIKHGQTIDFWYKSMTADYISKIMMLNEILGSKKQAAIKYIAEEMHKAHYGYQSERDLPWWITALEVINNIPISNNKVVLDNAMKPVSEEVQRAIEVLVDIKDLCRLTQLGKQAIDLAIQALKQYQPKESD